jgi:hypothetical protein
MPLSAIQAAMGWTERDVIEAIIGATFIADFGVVSAWPSTVGNKTKVDVQHAIKPKIVGVQVADPTETKGVEILWPGGGGQFSQEWDLAVGDPVLLIGLKDFVDTVASGLPSIPDWPMHYTQETMKAIPVGAFKAGSAVAMTVSGGLVQLKNASASLYTILNNLMSAINTFSNAAAQGAITTGGASSVALASAINVLLAAMNASIVSVTTLLGQLLKA